MKRSGEKAVVLAILVMALTGPRLVAQETPAPAATPTASDITIPDKDSHYPFYYVDVQQLLKDYPKAAAFETTLKSLAELARAELGTIEEKWRKATAAGQTDEAATLQKEYAALKQTHQQEILKKKQQMSGVIWDDLREKVKENFSTSPFGYVVVYDQKLGKNQSGHFISATAAEERDDLSGTRTDLTYALVQQLKKEPNSENLTSITTTPRYGPCYKVNFVTLIAAHPRHETVKATLQTVQEAETYSLTTHPEIRDLQQRIKRLSTEAGDPAEIQALISKRQTELRDKQTALETASQTRMNELRDRLIAQMMGDIEKAISILMEPEETYTIVSDHITSQALPAYQFMEGMTLPDITPQVAAYVKAMVAP